MTYKGVYKAHGKIFPEDPLEQLRLAICAVFDSWQSDRAIKYMDVQQITGLLGTAVNVQVTAQNENAVFLSRRKFAKKQQQLLEIINRGDFSSAHAWVCEPHFSLYLENTTKQLHNSTFLGASLLSSSLGHGLWQHGEHQRHRRALHA